MSDWLIVLISIIILGILIDPEGAGEVLGKIKYSAHVEYTKAMEGETE